MTYNLEEFSVETIDALDRNINKMAKIKLNNWIYESAKRLYREEVDCMLPLGYYTKCILDAMGDDVGRFQRTEWFTFFRLLDEIGENAKDKEILKLFIVTRHYEYWTSENGVEAFENNKKRIKTYNVDCFPFDNEGFKIFKENVFAPYKAYHLHLSGDIIKIEGGLSV